MPRTQAPAQPQKPVQADPVLRDLYRKATRHLTKGEVPEVVLADFYHGAACLLGERLITERELSKILRRNVDFARDQRKRRKALEDWPPEIRFGTRGQPLYLWSDVMDWLRRIRNVEPKF